MTVLLAGQAQPTVVLVPLAGWVDAGTQETPSGVVEQPVMAVIPLPMMGRMGLPTTLMVPTMVAAMQPVGTPPTQVEVAATVIGGS